jgi:hypothetical protein
MPFTFLFFLIFVLCSLISPLAILGVALAIFVPKWRQLGKEAAKFGVVSTLIFVVVAEALWIALGDGAERSEISMLMICGAGFTIGIIAMYVWKQVRKAVSFMRAGDT